MDRNGQAGNGSAECVWSLSARRAWIEINHKVTAQRLDRSLSARRAWIEINFGSRHSTSNSVALRKESVDRNQCMSALFRCRSVALRKESVDRNTVILLPIFTPPVALRKESVDRNIVLVDAVAVQAGRSPQGERG